MKIGRKQYWCWILVAAICWASALSCQKAESAASADAPVRWRFAIEEPRGSVQYAYATKFKELVEEKSDGEIQVTVFPYGTLGTSDQLTEQLDLGVIQFVMASPGHLGKLIPEVQVFLLHFIFSDDERLNQRVLNENPELRAKLNNLYNQKGMRLLSVFSEGWQVWTTQKPIREPDDFQGVKMRVMTSPLLLAAYEAYGASSTPLPYSEVYSALQLNMIDGQVNPIFAIEEMSFYEVTNYLIIPKQAQFFTTAVTNQEFFENLSPDRQSMVREVINELNDYIFQVQKELNTERLEIIKRKNPDLEIIRLTPEERAKFRKASLPVRQKYIDMVGPSGKKLLQKLLEAVEKAQNKNQSNNAQSPQG